MAAEKRTQEVIFINIIIISSVFTMNRSDSNSILVLFNQYYYIDTIDYYHGIT